MASAAQTVYQRRRLTLAGYHRMGQAGVLFLKALSQPKKNARSNTG